MYVEWQAYVSLRFRIVVYILCIKRWKINNGGKANEKKKLLAYLRGYLSGVNEVYVRTKVRIEEFPGWSYDFSQGETFLWVVVKREKVNLRIRLTADIEFFPI